MRRINLYICRHLAISTAISTAALVFAIWLTQSLRLIEVIVDGAAPVGLFLRLVLLAIPEFLTTVLPLGFVSAVLFTYNRLMTDSELVVLRAAGLGPLSIAKPAILVAAMVTLLAYALNFYVYPFATQEFRRLQSLIQSEYSSVLLREGQFNIVDDDITVYFRERRRSGELHGIFIHDSRDPAGPTTIIAERGVMAMMDTGPRVLMFDGVRQQKDDASGRLDELYFDQYAIDLQVIEPELGRRWPEPNERYVGDLLAPNRGNPDDLRYFGRLFAEGHQRLAGPMWVCAMTLLVLGILLSGEFHRRGQGRRTSLAVIGIIVMQAMALWLQSTTRDLPVVFPAMYVAPIFMTVLGGFLLYRLPAAMTSRRNAIGAGRTRA